MDKNYDALRELFRNYVLSIQGIAADYYNLLREVNEEGLISRSGYSNDVFVRLLDRADSELLRIAFFGAFSSGKSFLISALSNKVTYVTRTENKKQQEYYSSVIPTSPRPTSSCPLAVEPLPSTEREDKFWVFFDDRNTWEEKQPAIPAVIQAYATDLPNTSINRVTTRDRNRQVLKARLGVASAPLAAILYDLPGIGSTNFNHDKIVREFVQQADCIVYIAHVGRTLGNDDLELLRHVYEHHKTTGKPVFFVLTQIDKASDLDEISGKLIWEEVRDANNEFLRKYFSDHETGKSDMGFIGSGFIPVSAALEAKSVYYDREKRQQEEAKMLRDESNMQALRTMFELYLRETSGPVHLFELTVEVRRILSRLYQDIIERENSESTPQKNLQANLRGLKERRSVLIEGKKGLQDQLRDLGTAAIQRGFSGSDPDDLARLLEERLLKKIQTRDILKVDIIHDIETEQNAIVREWIARDRKALIPRWEGAWNSFNSQANERVEKLLTTSLMAQQSATKEEEELEADLAAIIPKVKSSDSEGVKVKAAIATFDVLSKTWQTYAVVAGVGGIGAAASSLVVTYPILATVGPVGWALLASAVIGGTFAQWKTKQQLKERREMMIREIQSYAREMVEMYRIQASEFIELRIGQIIEEIDNEIDRVSSSILSIEQRQTTGVYINSEKRLVALVSLLDRCSTTDKSISQQLAEVTKVQSSNSSLVS